MTDPDDPPDFLWSAERAEVALRRARSLIETAVESKAEAGYEEVADTLRAMIGPSPYSVVMWQRMLDLDPDQLRHLQQDARLLAEEARAKGLDDAAEVFEELKDATVAVAERKDTGEWPDWMSSTND